MKKYKSFLVIFSIMICSIGILEIETSAAEARYIPCSVGGKHYVESLGPAFWYSGTYQSPGSIVSNGATLCECTGCGTKLIVAQYPWNTVDGCQEIAWGVREIFSLAGVSGVYADVQGVYGAADMASDDFISGIEFY